RGHVKLGRAGTSRDGHEVAHDVEASDLIAVEVLVVQVAHVLAVDGAGFAVQSRVAGGCGLDFALRSRKGKYRRGSIVTHALESAGTVAKKRVGFHFADEIRITEKPQVAGEKIVRALSDRSDLAHGIETDGARPRDVSDDAVRAEGIS